MIKHFNFLTTKKPAMSGLINLFIKYLRRYLRYKLLNGFKCL